MNPAKQLHILLKISSAIMLLAMVAVVMPRSWMTTTHEKLGLGVFPDAAIAEYLARSVSALYAVYGGLLWLVSRDLVRYAAVITYLAVTGLVFAAAILLIDLSVGMPAWWTAAEAASVMLLSILILLLQARQRNAPGAPQTHQHDVRATE